MLVLWQKFAFRLGVGYSCQSLMRWHNNMVGCYCPELAILTPLFSRANSSKDQIIKKSTSAFFKTSISLLSFGNILSIKRNFVEGITRERESYVGYALSIQCCQPKCPLGHKNCEHTNWALYSQFRYFFRLTNVCTCDYLVQYRLM